MSRPFRPIFSVQALKTFDEIDIFSSSPPRITAPVISVREISPAKKSPRASPQESPLKSLPESNELILETIHSPTRLPHSPIQNIFFQENETVLPSTPRHISPLSVEKKSSPEKPPKKIKIPRTKQVIAPEYRNPLIERKPGAPPPPTSIPPVDANLPRKSAVRGGVRECVFDDLPSGTGIGNVFAYVRLSTEERTGKQITSQIESIQNYIEYWDTIDPFDHKQTRPPEQRTGIRKFYFDNGVPGSFGIDARPQLKQLFADIVAFNAEKKTILEMDVSNVLVVYDVSRLTRSTKVGEEILEMTISHKTLIHTSSNRQILRKKGDKMMFKMLVMMAAQERSETQKRVRSHFETQRKKWDPRKSFGWRFLGAGTKPEEIPEEQVILEEIRELYEDQGRPTAEIGNFIQSKHGSRRCRQLLPLKDGSMPDDVLVKWTGTEISALAKRNEWTWGGSDGVNCIKNERELHKMALKAEEDNINLDRFLELHRGKLVDGVRINKLMLKERHFVSEMPEPKKKAFICLFDSLPKDIEDDEQSIDDYMVLLGVKVPRANGEKWPRQTVWSLLKLVRFHKSVLNEYHSEMRIKARAEKN